VTKNGAQLSENTLLCATTFPKRRFLGKVAYVVHYGAVVPLTVGFGTTAAANPGREPTGARERGLPANLPKVLNRMSHAGAGERVAGLLISQPFDYGNLLVGTASGVQGAPTGAGADHGVSGTKRPLGKISTLKT
jgi:hypothetical protein